MNSTIKKTLLYSIIFIVSSTISASLLSEIFDDGEYHETPTSEVKKKKKEIWREKKFTETDKIAIAQKTAAGTVAGGIVGGVAQVLTAGEAVVAAGEAAAVAGEAAAAAPAVVATGKVAAAGAAKAVAAGATVISLPVAIGIGAVAGGLFCFAWAVDEWKEHHSENG